MATTTESDPQPVADGDDETDSVPSPSVPSSPALPRTLKARPYATLLRVGLQPLIVHFHAFGNGYIEPSTLETLDTKVLKRILSETARELSVREEIGHDEKVWEDLRQALIAGVDCLQLDSCERLRAVDHDGKEAVNGDGATDEGYEEGEDDLIASSSRIVRNWKTLTRDVARMILLVGIARNVLTVGAAVQDLCASRRVEEAAFQLISLCVRVTGRGFDAGTADQGVAGSVGTNPGGLKDQEKRWQAVVNDFKRLLCTCVQFLNNLCVQNERRKLLLWLQLFDSSAEGDVVGAAALDRRLILSLRDDPVVNGWMGKRGNETFVMGKEGVPHVIRRFREGLMAHMMRYDSGGLGPGSKKDSNPLVLDRESLSSSPFLLYIGKVGMDIKKELTDAGSSAGATEIAAECKRRWQEMSKEEQKNWHDYYNKLLDNYREESIPSRASTTPETVEEQPRDGVIMLAQRVEQMQSDLKHQIAADLLETRGESGETGHDIGGSAELGHEAQFEFSKPATADAELASDGDYEVKYSAHYGAEILHRGKDDLLRRLEPENTRLSRSRRARTRSPPLPPPVELPPRSESQPIPDPPDAPLTLASEDERELLSEEEEDDDSDYDDPVPGDDGRGLLTDVPLILGPTEIEVLPMIIQSGIVPPTSSQPGHGESKEEDDALRSLHRLRCNLLLAQDNGRNLIRELLIFVAAWDLRDEELYFQLMTQIIEAVLVNGLLPFSYHAFRENKDIISPAQAVIMKLLTHIFRRRQAETGRKGPVIFPRSQNRDGKKPVQAQSPHPAMPNQHIYPQKVDVRMVSFLLTEFRRHIIPQTCALIFLQGQIRHGIVSPEDFPLNLWDMERMYEGIYQYLEFFAILTEHERWKQMMADWDITSELITLLEELDAAIPRATARNSAKNEAIKRAATRTLAPLESHTPPVMNSQQHIPPAHSVERPYDPSDVDTQPYDPASAHLPHASTPQPPSSPVQSEPSDFEWRNLKKLAVLVLSSLVWKSEKVQHQLSAPTWIWGTGRYNPESEQLDVDAAVSGSWGEKGRGIRALLNCCKVDDFNPYIREHAIMALRFALEGHQGNQDVIRDLERVDTTTVPNLSPNPATSTNNGSDGLPASGMASLRDHRAPTAGAVDVTARHLGNGRAEIRTATGIKVEVPREVLDLNGYETFVDTRGQVQLKKRDFSAANAIPAELANDGMDEDDFM